jgi:hypothetical protein
MMLSDNTAERVHSCRAILDEAKIGYAAAYAIAKKKKKMKFDRIFASKDLK